MIWDDSPPVTCHLCGWFFNECDGKNPLTWGNDTERKRGRTPIYWWSVDCMYGVFTNKLVKKQSIRGRTPVEPHLFLFFQRHCSLLITQCPCVTSKKKKHVPAIFVPSGWASQGHSHRMWFPGHSGCCTAPRSTYFFFFIWVHHFIRKPSLKTVKTMLQCFASACNMVNHDKIW